MRNLGIFVLSGLFVLLTLSLRSEATKVTVISVEGYDAATSFESRAGCITTLVQVALYDHKEQTKPAGAVVVRQSGVVTLTQFSDPENGKDPQTGQDCPALALQDASVTLEPVSDEVDLQIDPTLEKARFAGQAPLKDQEGNDQLLLFEVMWKAAGPLKPGHRVDNYQEGKKTVRTVYRAKSRPAVVYGFIGQCDNNQDGVCSAEEEETAVNYLNTPSQGEDTFIRWRKIRTTVQVEE